MVEAIGEVHGLDRGVLGLRLGLHAHVELLLLRQVADLGRKVDRAAGPQVAPDLLDVRAQGVAEVLFQRHVAPHEVQHQLGALEAGRQTPLAGHAGLVVAPFEVAERPVAVEHLQRAADVAKRIGKLVVADRAMVRRQQQVLVHRLIRPLAPHPQVEVDRAAGIERADHFGRFLGQGRQQRLVELDVVAFGFEPAGGGREGMRRLGGQSNRLAPAVRRQVHLELVVLQIQRSLAVFQPVRELVVRQRHVQAADRHFRPPRLTVEGKPHVGIHLAGRAILVPLLLRSLGEDVHQRAVQIQLAEFGRQRERTVGLETRPPARHPQRGLAAAGRQIVDRVAAVIGVYRGADVGQGMGQAPVVDPPAAQPPGEVVFQRHHGRRVVAQLEPQVALTAQVAKRREFRRQRVGQAATQLRRDFQPFGLAADRAGGRVQVDPALDFHAAETVAGKHPLELRARRDAAVGVRQTFLLCPGQTGMSAGCGGTSVRFTSRSVSVLAGAFSGSKISMTPPSTVTSGGRSLEPRRRQQFCGAPGAVGPMRDAQRGPADRYPPHRRVALDELLPLRRALEERFLDVQQLRVRSLGAGLDDREIVNPNALSLHQLGGADADLQAGVVLGDPRFEPAANLLINPMVEIGDGHRADDDHRHDNPLEAKPAAVDHTRENQKNPPWLKEGLGIRD